MKKVYLSFLLLGVTAGAYAQQTTKPYSFGEISTATVKPGEVNPAPKALGVEIWGDNFDDGTNWTIDNDGQPGGTHGWSIDATADSWWTATGINSTSGGGFAEVANGDPNANGQGNTGNQVANVTYSMTSIVLDIPNLPGNTANTDQVTLQYEEFGARFNDVQLTEISTDGGTTWTELRDNRDHYEVLSGSGGAAYQNPELVTINLAPYITGAANTVAIRFSWTSGFSLPVGSGAWIAYGWYIDDLKIVTNPDNDIESLDPYWGTAFLNYSMIPTTQVAPIDFVSIAFNNGLATQNNVELNVDVNGGAWTGVSQSANIAAGDYDSLVVSTQYTPAAVVGSHSFTWEITQNEVDDVPANNIITGGDFDVTEFVYGHDDDIIDGYRGNSGEAYEVGSWFDIWNDQTAYYIDTKLHSSSVVGSTVYAKIYSWDGTQATFNDALTFVQQTDYHTVQPSDMGNLLSLPLLLPTNLTATQGEYFVVVCTDGDGGSTNDVRVATSGFSDFSRVYISGDDTWYLQPETPIVRLNFDGSVWGLNEESNISALNVFPNPANDVVNVDFNVINSSDVKVEVLDMTGKVITVVSEATNVVGAQNATINTSNFAAGMYNINITTNEGVIKSKFVKQ